MRIGWVHKLVNKWPGKSIFGMYRFLPMFFVLGAALEFSMINWKVGEVNFYNTFKRRQAHEIVEEKIKKYTVA
ncbi:small integral membrane protein 4 [Helicoverpa zea]|uniref:small integral membrane protein 4 n=1 Tax=Helicoverpa zea TaxID=7113 RepID=UPI001F596B55|nr:small integral membrane protein 4 [Helicoverpa armigera]XP_047021429.1 small integral membrane protein 4 [Helicoverpa zea]